MLTIPIYDTILLPDVTFYFKKEVIDGWNIEELYDGQELIFAMLKEDKDVVDGVSLDEVYPIGVSAKIESIDSDGNVKVRTKDRVNFISFGQDPDGNIDAEVVVRPEMNDMSVDERKTKFEKLKKEFLGFVQKYQWGIWARGFILQWKNINELACSMSGYFALTWEEKVDYVMTDSAKVRFEKIEHASYEFMEMARVNNEASDAQKKQNESLYREDAIKKQINILQKELDDMHPENISDVRKF